MLTHRFPMLGSAALAVVSTLALLAQPAHARGGWRVGVGISYGPPPPPPPPVVVVRPAPVVVVRPYYPPPPVRVYAPAPVMVAPAPVMVEQPAHGPVVGLAAYGVAEVPGNEQPGTGGLALALQVRTSRHAMLLLEVEGVGAPHVPQGPRRADAAGLIGLRLLPWDGPLAMFVDLAAGLGESTFYCCGERLHSQHLVGRYGLGLELRLSPHLVLEGQLGRIHRLTYDTEDALLSPEDEHRSALDLRAGVAFRF